MIIIHFTSNEMILLPFLASQPFYLCCPTTAHKTSLFTLGVQELWQGYREHRALLKRAEAFAIHPSERPPSKKASSKTASKIPIPIPEPLCTSCNHLCPQFRVFEGVRRITADSEPQFYWEQEDCQKWLQLYLVKKLGMAKEARLLEGGFVGCGTAMFKWRLDEWRDMLGPLNGVDVFFSWWGGNWRGKLGRRVREEWRRLGLRQITIWIGRLSQIPGHLYSKEDLASLWLRLMLKPDED
jgi:hypothetical protein